MIGLGALGLLWLIAAAGVVRVVAGCARAGEP